MFRGRGACPRGLAKHTVVWVTRNTLLTLYGEGSCAAFINPSLNQKGVLAPCGDLDDEKVGIFMVLDISIQVCAMVCPVLFNRPCLQERIRRVIVGRIPHHYAPDQEPRTR